MHFKSASWVMPLAEAIVRQGFAHMAAPVVCDMTNLVHYQNEQLKRFRTNLRLSLTTEDMEAVHDLRVASRRLSDALNLMGAWVGRKRTARAQRALKRIRKAFRNVRDLDVFRLSLSEDAGQGMIDIDLAAQIESIFGERRQRALAEARRTAEQPECSEEIDAIEQMNETFLELAQRKPGKLEKQLGRMLQERAEALLEHDPRMEEANLHETRICVKKMRYCAQLVDTCKCLGSHNLMDLLVEMQDTLGHWSDQVVAVRTLGRLAGRWKLVSYQTAFSEKILEYAVSRAKVAMNDQQKVLAQWTALAASVQVAVPSLTIRSGGLIRNGGTPKDAGTCDPTA